MLPSFHLKITHSQAARRVTPTTPKLRNSSRPADNLYYESVTRDTSDSINKTQNPPSHEG